MIINHEHPAYIEKRESMHSGGRFNGAYYYSVEICKNIIPHIKTDRNWITVNLPDVGCDHAIVFIHNNMNPYRYDWLRKYEDLILVCGVPETCEKVKHLGQTIYLPLSIDVAEVARHKKPKTKICAFVGRMEKRLGIRFAPYVDFLCNMPREDLLESMAEYENVYAVGRCALEAKVLECNVLPYDNRYPDPEFWKVMDNSDAIKILQRELDIIDS